MFGVFKRLGFSKGIMFGVTNGIFFEYKGKVMSFGCANGLNISYYISDYREITKEERKYINDIGYDLVRVNSKPIVYIVFSCLEEAINKKDEFRLSLNWGKSYVLRLYKKSI